MSREGDVIFLVTPFVEGLTLEERLGRGPLSTGEAITVGRCLLAALREAHDHGVIHRDVKPANVIVDAGSPLTRATLIDFGLARSARLTASIRDQPVGTVRYISPEQAGLIEREVDGRSDLYSAGLVLYKCLAGRPAFEGKSVGEVLREHLAVEPAGLRQSGCAVPRALEEVVRRLIRKDPRNRYQTAEAAFADLDEIARALERGEPEPAIVVGERDRRRTIGEPAFVGRERETALLEGQLARAREGRGGLVLLEADSGGGKTRLLDEFAARAAQGGAFVLRGQGVERAAEHPFRVLDGLVRGIRSAAVTPLRARAASRTSSPSDTSKPRKLSSAATSRNSSSATAAT